MSGETLDTDDSRVVVYAETDEVPNSLDQEIIYRLIIAWKGEDFEVTYRIPKIPLEKLELINVTQKGETQIQQLEVTQKRTLTYRLKPLETGEVSVKNFVFEYFRPDRPEPQRAEIGTTIFKVLPPPKPVSPLLFLVPAAVGAVGLPLSFFFMLKARNKPLGEKRKISISDLEDKAILELSRLEPLLEDGRTRDLISKSGILFRDYLKTKYALSSQKLTGQELVGLIDRRRDISAEDKKTILGILQYISETQFGGVPPTKDEAFNIHNRICDFIVGRKVV